MGGRKSSRRFYRSRSRKRSGARTKRKGRKRRKRRTMIITARKAGSTRQSNGVIVKAKTTKGRRGSDEKSRSRATRTGFGARIACVR